jgi:hypothetical protein
MAFFKKKELTPEEKAEEIFKEHYICCGEHQVVYGNNPLAITKDSMDPFSEDRQVEYSLWELTGENSGYSFSKEEIIKAIITFENDWEKTVSHLIDFREKKAKKEWKKRELEEEIDKIKERERKRKLREKAEKKIYGKKKTKRLLIPVDEKEMVLSKFNNQCAVCTQTEGLHIHHKDNNPSNNQMENLVVLCGVCHKKTHMKVR